MRKVTLLVFVILIALLLAVMVLRFLTPSPAVQPIPEETAPPEAAETQKPTPAPTPELTPEPTPSPEPTPYRPDVDITEWNFILANPANAIGDYVPELTELEGGQLFDSRAVEYLQAFVDAGRAAGYSVVINSSYRSYDTQNYLYWRKVEQCGGDQAVAATIVAPPGTSEHQTGLCCDIADQFYSVKDSSLENTATYHWLYEHCAEYGFILRYPKDKGNITGIIYEPWHFRYVGVEAAQFIMDEGLCLEEFLALYA